MILQFLLPKIAPLNFGADDEDLSSKTNAELKHMLDEKGVVYPSNAKKMELIELLGG